MKNLVGIFLIFLFSAPILNASQPLETETARLARAGTFEADATVEYQTSPDGTETAVPFAIEYGITDRWELLVEPVFFTAIKPKMGKNSTGPGDTEVTLTALVSQEKVTVPAVAFAAEVKFPTATDRFIGTGKADY